MNRLTAVAVGVVAVASWAQGATDLSWIGQLDGVAPVVQRGSTGGRAVYQVTGDAAQAFQRVQAGLVDHGWSISQGASIAGSVHALVATQGDAKVSVALTGNTLSVSRDRAGGAAASGAAGATMVATSGGGSFSLLENSQTQAFECNAGGNLEIMGNDNQVTFTGTCRRLTLSGNGNHVRFDGSIERIETTGNNNRVAWSVDKNPKKPKVSNLGTGNELRPEPPAGK
jgi:hypothetical protein